MTVPVTLITATGSRPEAFALLEKFISRQTYRGNYQWIVIDDCNPVTKVTLGQEYHRGPKLWTPGINTQRLNLDHVLRFIRGENILIIEDDDYLTSTYIETMLWALKKVEVVGSAIAKYFNLQIPGWKELKNTDHSSLCATGLRKSQLPLLDEAINSGEKYIDVAFWKKVREQHVPHLLFRDIPLCIGMKGVPGREGIGVGHTQRDYFFDPKLTKLEEWIGQDVALYKSLLKRPQKSEITNFAIKLK